jgi:hypothetical protein
MGHPAIVVEKFLRSETEDDRFAGWERVASQGH